MWETEKELAAIRELYDLKCQEVDYLKGELEQKQRVKDKVQQKTEIFCTRSLRMLESGLEELDRQDKHDHRGALY